MYFIMVIENSTSMIVRKPEKLGTDKNGLINTNMK